MGEPQKQVNSVNGPFNGINIGRRKPVIKWDATDSKKRFAYSFRFLQLLFELPDYLQSEAERSTVRCCAVGKQCVGSLPAGCEYKGELLKQETFLYADGSRDEGRLRIACRASHEGYEYGWMEDLE